MSANEALPLLDIQVTKSLPHPEGARMGTIQDQLFSMRPMLDNPLRAPRSHPLAVAGVIELSLEKDLGTLRSISLERKDTYLGHCSGCPDLCGIESKSACVGMGTAQLELGVSNA